MKTHRVLHGMRITTSNLSSSTYLEQSTIVQAPHVVFTHSSAALAALRSTLRSRTCSKIPGILVKPCMINITLWNSKMNKGKLVNSSFWILIEGNFRQDLKETWNGKEWNQLARVWIIFLTFPVIKVYMLSTSMTVDSKCVVAS